MRFRLRTLLILIAAVALWLSTIAGYESANDVRALLMQSVLVACGIYQNVSLGGNLNPRYAFWMSTIHAVVMLLIATVMGLLGVLVFGGNRHAKQSVDSL